MRARMLSMISYKNPNTRENEDSQFTFMIHNVFKEKIENHKQNCDATKEHHFYARAIFKSVGTNDSGGTFTLKVLSEFIAPWALSKEMIPLHIFWESESTYDLIRIHLPREFKMHECFNVDEYSIEESTILIKKLKTPNYFALVISATETYDEAITRKEVIAEFLDQGEVKYRHSFEAKIVRPLLQIAEPPKPITVKEGVDPRNLIKISLKYFGLGTAKIDVYASHRGRTISHTEPLYYHILKRMVDQKIFLDTSRKEKGPAEKEGIDIDSEALAKITETMMERIRRGIVPPDLNQEALKEFSEWTKDHANLDKLMKIIYSEIEHLMIGAILYYLDRHPSENVELVRGMTRTVFRSKIEEIQIEIRYTDSLKNAYKPVELAIKVDDQRKNVEKIFEAPVNLRFITERIDLGE